jgi:tripartite-type tricarboxylate transporter receptor subunit TctC
MRYGIASRSALALVVGLASLSFLVDDARSQTPYYQGKTITILRGGEPGGTGDLQARALIPFLEKYLPGRPKIIVTNMPGAAGRKAANHIYSTVKPDGLTIGAVGAGLVVGPILGLAGTIYDLDKLIYLGSTESGDPYFFLSRKEAGLDTLEKLRSASGLRSEPKRSAIRSTSPAGCSRISSASRNRGWSSAMADWSSTLPSTEER